MRFVGALAVLTTHTSFQTGTYLQYDTLGTLTARLDVGVAIFFALSGFLLSRPYVVRSRHALPPPRTRRYYEKRLLRIVPTYVVTVVVALSLVPGNDRSDLAQWVSSLTMVDTYRLKLLPHGLTHMWSLAAEVAFYLLLPMLMALALGRRASAPRFMFVLSAMTAGSVCWLLWWAPSLEGQISGGSGLWLPAYLSWFAGGIGLAWLHVLVGEGRVGMMSRHLVQFLTMPGVCWSVILGLMLVSATPIAGPTLLVQGTEGQGLTKHVIYALVGLLAVGSAVFAPSGAFSRFFSLPALRHLGHISYSLFCIHLAVLSLVLHLLDLEPFTGGGLQVWVLTLVLSLVASELLYRIVELPALRVKARLRRADIAEAQAPTAQQAQSVT